MSEPLAQRFAGTSTLVTGGAGFIGSHLVEALVALGSRVVVLDDLSLGREDNLAAVRDRVEVHVGDCAELEALRSLAAESFDMCFNLAVIPLPHSLVRPRENVDRNVAMTTAVCEFGREGGFQRLVQYSSSEVYGTARSAPMDEDHPLGAHTPYAAAKAATDLVAASYAVTFRLPVVTVRPFNTYGERQNDAAYAGLIPAVIRAVQSGRPVTVFGDGEQTRDMAHVSDTIRGTLQAAATDAALGGTFNLGAGEEFSVNRIVAGLLKALGRPEHPVHYAPERAGDVRRLLADTSRARAAFGYAPRVGLDEGLRRAVEWYLTSEAATSA